MIDADALAEAIGVKRLMTPEWKADSAWGVPIVDAEPVRHGRWMDMGDFIYCSICNVARMKEFLSDYGVAVRLDVRTNYCPHCGAKMDGGNE
jgi:hypothetical protein